LLIPPTFSYIFDTIETVVVIPRMSESDALIEQRPAEMTESIHAMKLGPLTVEATWHAWTAFVVGLFLGFIPTALVVYDVLWGDGKIGWKGP
jgi:hypothetical protein